MNIQSFFKKTYFLTISSSIICTILGLLLILYTSESLSTISIFLGVVLIFIGFSMIYRYFSDGVIRYLFGFSLIYALLDIILGFIMINKPDSIVLLIALFVAFTLIIEFISKMQLGMILKKFNVDNWLYEIIIGILLLLASILLISSPVRGTLALTKIMGILIISSSIINVIDCLVLKSKLNNIKRKVKDLFV